MTPKKDNVPNTVTDDYASKNRERNSENEIAYWSIKAAEVLSDFSVDKEKGLSQSEVRKRREKYGKNQLQTQEPTPWWRILANQFKSILVGLLVVATIASFAFGRIIEGWAIGVVIIINALLGFFTELKAIRSMEAISEMTRVETKVLRDGSVQNISAVQLVPGDIIVVDAGDIISVDMRLFEASKLQANEASLTGESVPVSKQVDPVDEDSPLAERKSMLYKGTNITRGSGKGITTSIGQNTELGKVSSLLKEAGEEEETPLEKRLQKLGQKLIWATLAIAVVVGVAGWLQDKPIFQMLELSISLAVATVPEGLPIVATIALARGMRRMAKQQAIMNKLSAVETLGSTKIICTDKTGTLTESKMTVKRIELPSRTVEVTGTGMDITGEFKENEESINANDDELVKRILEVGVLCNNASLNLEDGSEEAEGIGEPMEVALLVAGRKAKTSRPELLKQNPEEKEFSFDADLKMMATINKKNGKFRISVKGAPSAIIQNSSKILTNSGESKFSKDEKDNWLEKNHDLASKGLRMLAMAEKEADQIPDEDPYDNLTFLGMCALLDPARTEVKPAIETCHQAGLRLIMVTGDQIATAKYIARELNIAKSDEIEAVSADRMSNYNSMSQEEKDEIARAQVFARVTPENKLRLIELHQDRGNVVAMTGDGVNDAPALRKADIGIAMGKRGTQVAKEASDMILQDDNFATIPIAIRQGRVIFNNIRKFIFYLLSCNLSEMLLILFATLLGLPAPIRALQILFLNMVTDIFPAFALSANKGEDAIMKRDPRDPDEPVLRDAHWRDIIIEGLILTLVVLASFIIGDVVFTLSPDGIVTISFITLAYVQLIHVFNMRDSDAPFFRNEITENKYVWGAIALSMGLVIMAVYIPGLSTLLHTIPLGIKHWLFIGAFTLLSFVLVQLWIWARKKLNLAI